MTVDFVVYISAENVFLICLELKYIRFCDISETQGFFFNFLVYVLDGSRLEEFGSNLTSDKSDYRILLRTRNCSFFFFFQIQKSLSLKKLILFVFVNVVTLQIDCFRHFSMHVDTFARVIHRYIKIIAPKLILIKGLLNFHCIWISLGWTQRIMELEDSKCLIAFITC